MPSQKGTSEKEKDLGKTPALEVDATSRLNMADSKTTHGEKRRVSLSPSQTPAPKKQINNSLEETRKRKNSVSAEMINIFSQTVKDPHIEHETGNDPNGGQLETGSELEDRSESNMAAPTKENKPKLNNPPRWRKISSFFIPAAHAAPSFSKKGENEHSQEQHIEMKIPMAETEQKQPSPSGSIIISDDENSSPPPASSHRTASKLEARDINILVNTSSSVTGRRVGDVGSPHETASTYNQVDTSGSVADGRRAGDVGSPQVTPSTLNQNQTTKNGRPLTPTPTSSPLLAPSGSKPSTPTPVPSACLIPPTPLAGEDVSPTFPPTPLAGEDVSPTTPLLNRLRSKAETRAKKTHKLQPPSTCKDCLACSDCTSASNKKSSNAKLQAKPNMKPKQQQPTRGRGRPRKSASTSGASQAPVTKKAPQVPQDFRTLLLEIKEEVSTVSDKQESCSEDLCTLMDTKMTDLKESLGGEMKVVKDQVRNNSTLLSELQNAQVMISNKIEAVNSIKDDVTLNTNTLSEVQISHAASVQKVENLDEKIVTLEDRTSDMEVDIIRQKKGIDQVNLNLSQQISDIEYGLAAHVEKVKNNVEIEMAGAKHSQVLIENKLTNFTIEIQNQNAELNTKMRDLRGDFERLKTLSDRIRDTPTPCSFSDNSDDIFQSGNDQGSPQKANCYTNSCDPGNDDSFYMYGDTTRSLIIDGMKETRHENLGEKILHCINDIGVHLAPNDIESVFRIGKNDTNRQWPRPIKLVLKDQTKRARLRFTNSFRDVRVNAERRRDVRVRAAKLRQAGQTAQKMGHKVETRLGEIRIDGKRYDTLSLNDIPSDFMTEANSIKNPPKNTHRISLFDKNTTKADSVIMVGPSLQKIPYGLAFFSIQCFLSNFFKCGIYFEGSHYNSAEQCYQCMKAEVHDDRSAYEEIYSMNSPARMKQRGSDIRVNKKWDELKLRVMEDILLAKFRQNKKLYYSLLNTRPMTLIEATLDTFWGAGCILCSIALEEGSWEGQNHLGRQLLKIRNTFV